MKKDGVELILEQTAVYFIICTLIVSVTVMSAL